MFYVEVDVHNPTGLHWWNLYMLHICYNETLLYCRSLCWNLKHQEMLEKMGMKCFFFFYQTQYCGKKHYCRLCRRLCISWFNMCLPVCRWAVERLHFGWSWQQSRYRPGAQPLTSIQSKSPVTAGSSQPDRRSWLAQPLPTSYYLFPKHTG